MHYAVILGFLAILLGNVIYIRDTLSGTIQPNRISQFLWGAAPLISGLASISQGATWVTVPTLSMASFAFLTFAATFYNPKAYWRLGLFDWICGVLSVAALVLWYLTQNSNIAIVFAILSDVAATVPVLKKCWTHPDSEAWVSYFCGSFNALTSFFAVKLLTFGELAFPTYYFLSCILITSIIVLRRRNFLRNIN